eukprot:TRINITY_DN5663_c0_g1_i2.p1 TRINITY_DN5663_c0_g1~~TRINITY_DN5663_c0_g1_i2.p1  ORF type:complete len:126 (-),score=15.38 TRINITY_DN5663_c0_g1_i2:309-686(-)
MDTRIAYLPNEMTKEIVLLLQQDGISHLLFSLTNKTYLNSVRNWCPGPRGDLIELACKNGYVSIFQWLTQELKYSFDPIKCSRDAIETGALDLVHFLDSYGSFQSGYDDFVLAVRNGTVLSILLH